MNSNLGKVELGMQASDEGNDRQGWDQQEDRGEFVRVFTKHSRRILRYILTLTVNHADADEAFQATSLVLWRKFGQFDPTLGSFYTWACRIAFFEVLRLRQTKRHEAKLSDEVMRLLAEELDKRSDEFESREVALEQCLKELPSKDYQLIALRYFNSRSPKEIAEVLDRSTHAVYRALVRVHGMLRRCVSRKLAHEGL